MADGPDDSLATLTDEARRFVEERDWGRFHGPRNLAMALTVEAGELLELYLWSEDGGPQPRRPAQRERVAHEAADVLLCLLNFCREAEIDLAEAFREKLALARARYPVEKARGRAVKWDELLEESRPETGPRTGGAAEAPAREPDQDP